MFAAFLAALSQEFPDVLDSARTFVITGATMNPTIYRGKNKIFKDEKRFQDDAERAVIEWLGSTALNRQSGGKYAEHNRPYEDAELFGDLDTNYWHKVCGRAEAPSDLFKGQIQAHFQVLQDEINENAAFTGGNYTDGLRDAAAL